MDPSLGQMDGLRKRGREDEYQDNALGGTSGFSEHRTKRLQALPLRSPPRARRMSGPPALPTAFHPYPPARTITPGDSDSEEIANGTHEETQQPKSHFSPWSSSQPVASQASDCAVMEPQVTDHDLDMMDTSSSLDSHQQQNPDLLGPGPFQPDPVQASITARMPTPIHCSFAQQVRGTNWTGAAGNMVHTAPGVAPFVDPRAEGLTEAHIHSAQESYLETGMNEDKTVPRSLDGPAAAAAVMADWSMVQNRRLPSPISESGGEDVLRSPRTPGMVLDGSPNNTGHYPGHKHLTLTSLPPRSSSAMELSHSSPPDASSAAQISNNTMDVEPSQSPKKGHTRSRHTLNSWTLQPGMKKSFSIGYRADCEKCRLKVPGHFNHIIIS